MLFSRSGKVWVGQRIDTPDAWHMPQGGIMCTFQKLVYHVTVDFIAPVCVGDVRQY